MDFAIVMTAVAVVVAVAAAAAIVAVPLGERDVRSNNKNRTMTSHDERGLQVKDCEVAATAEAFRINLLNHYGHNECGEEGADKLAPPLVLLPCVIPTQKVLRLKHLR